MTALSDEEVVQSNSLGIVTRRCVAIRDADGHSCSVMSLSEIVEIETVKTNQTPLLVIACGLFLVAAAAYFSKEGDGASVPMAGLGLAFMVGYVLSWRASVILISPSDRTESTRGSLREAAKFVKALNAAMKERKEEEEESREESARSAPDEQSVPQYQKTSD